MILLNLHPAEPARRKQRAYRAAMTPERRKEYYASTIEATRRRRETDPEGVRARDRERDHGDRRAQVLAAGRRHRLRSFGLTEESFSAMLLAQGSVCACCGGAEPGRSRGGKATSWCIDHDHQTGKVRGILCHPCNAGIGMLGDNHASVQRAADYLKRAEESP